MSFKGFLYVMAVIGVWCLLLGLDIGMTSWAYHTHGKGLAWAIGAPLSIFLFMAFAAFEELGNS